MSPRLLAASTTLHCLRQHTAETNSLMSLDRSPSELPLPLMAVVPPPVPAALVERDELAPLPPELVQLSILKLNNCFDKPL